MELLSGMEYVNYCPRRNSYRKIPRNILLVSLVDPANKMNSHKKSTLKKHIDRKSVTKTNKSSKKHTKKSVKKRHNKSNCKTISYVRCYNKKK